MPRADPAVTPRLARAAVALAAVALALLSLLPRDQMVRTGAAGWSEHLVAYGGTMTLAAIGYADRIGLARPCAALIVYAALLEIGQTLSPGRTPAFTDFLAGAAGALAAALVAAALRRHRQR